MEKDLSVHPCLFICLIVLSLSHIPRDSIHWKRRKKLLLLYIFYAWVSLTDILEKAEHDVQDLPAARKQEVKFLAKSRCLSWFPSVTLITAERTGWKGFIYKTLHSIFWLSRDQRKIKWKMPPRLRPPSGHYSVLKSILHFWWRHTFLLYFIKQVNYIHFNNIFISNKLMNWFACFIQ